MCKALYLASNKPLPESKWDEQNPAFYVEALAKADTPVRRHFSKPYVYYAGAHEGCGCGFGYGDFGDPVLEASDALGKRSLEQLFTFLRAQSQTAGPLEMYYCWEGDEGRRAKAAATIELATFRLPEDTYYLPVRTKIDVVSEPNVSTF